MNDVVRYRNPWHRPNERAYGPEYYESYGRARKRGEWLIYKRGSVYDCVQNGVCHAQYAGPNGANGFVDQVIEGRADALAAVDRNLKLIEELDATPGIKPW
jgi:hypothetical protein